MKKALAIGLAAVMAVSMSAPVFAEDEAMNNHPVTTSWEP